MKLYADGKQYSDKTDLWEAVNPILFAIEPDEIKNLTQWIIDYWMLLRKWLKILRGKYLKMSLYMFVICSITGVD